MARIGILALQGDFAAHGRVLRGLGFDPVFLREPADLSEVKGLVLPGGESTTFLKLLHRFDLEQPLTALAAKGAPVLATCAGLIVIAKDVTDPCQRSLGWLDVQVARNAWGRQVHSFEAVSDDGAHPLVFIRAPRITRVGDGVQVLATLKREPILVRQGNIFGAAFHPELTADVSIHREIFGSCR
jgi:5'-phosphate synthase pdxT subunit